MKMKIRICLQVLILFLFQDTRLFCQYYDNINDSILQLIDTVVTTDPLTGELFYSVRTFTEDWNNIKNYIPVFIEDEKHAYLSINNQNTQIDLKIIDLINPDTRQDTIYYSKIDTFLISDAKTGKLVYQFVYRPATKADLADSNILYINTDSPINKNIPAKQKILFYGIYTVPNYPIINAINLNDDTDLDLLIQFIIKSNSNTKLFKFNKDSDWKVIAQNLEIGNQIIIRSFLIYDYNKKLLDLPDILVNFH